MDIHKQIREWTGITDNDKYYWGYMYGLGKDVIVPLLKSIGAFRKGDAVAEIGSAEGGVLAAFVEEGATEGLGTDINVPRIECGRKIAEHCGLDIFFTAHDIIYQEPADEWKEKYDLVLLRDVIEHLDDTEVALVNIRKIIKKGGRLYVTFPPYHSPFGGHQHTLGNKAGKLPYIHLLPKFIFNLFMKSGREADITEVNRLHQIRLTPRKFLKAVKKAGYAIEREDYYLLRPVFKMKFGLPSLKISFLRHIPFLRDAISLEGSYLLKKI